MRTYILAMFNKQTKQYTRYQCQAFSFKEAVLKAQQDLSGCLPGTQAGNAVGGGNVSFNA
ncbi:hypothetical protein Q1Z72_00875 [Pseudomonas qingdaonensis]|jgi:phosphopantetheinyl transferase (holo-ACP synthase)|uniref:hypothetical protein n=1 Tax=Pseudomonas qingdaonensis TaxID=2056231 RepID=UPI00265FC972|nr:hypothetical protein [Pseudomonas qingdaonensis]WKL67262.1 hypothetical protein Q1Z72_00875 [Pseudomonas qingdaonensis]